MKWVTRERPKIDRLACPWLARRFIEAEAEVLYVPANAARRTAEETGAIPFDVPDVELGHEGERCSFDAFLKKYALHDPARSRAIATAGTPLSFVARWLPDGSRTRSRSLGMRAAAWSFAVFSLLPALTAHAFPPYRSTDGATAPLGVLEARLGLIRVQREADANRYAAPLLRLNLGFAERAELVFESEYDLEEDHLGDGALGLKLVTDGQAFRWGLETLALLPVSSGQSGLGVEAQVLATWKRAPVLVHFNVGGIYDSRPENSEQGWRASVLAELEHATGRAGLELFARELRHEATEVQLGAGWIVPVGPVDLRIGLHAGITRRAPDFTASLWLSTQRTLWTSQAN